MSGLKDSKMWTILPVNKKEEKELEEKCNISNLCARVLVGRGMTDPSQVHEFLNPNLDDIWKDPLLIPGMEQVASRVEQAIKNDETIAIFGDFDVDGISSTCLLTLALRDLNASVFPFIPHRFDEGYGLSHDALERVIEACHPNLIITVDNGISAAEEVEWLKSKGVDIVITDHHEPGDAVPQGVPVADPKLSDSCTSRELAGAGVALKLICELGARFGKKDLWRNYIDIATLGTISDMMVLQGENRALVKKGVEMLQRTQRPGIIALCESACCSPRELKADTLPFSLIPRLNAAGRMGSVDIAFDLLMAQNLDDARMLASSLENINEERRNIESSLSANAIAKVEATYDGSRIVVVGGEEWHEGVKGIVASRLSNKWHVPAIVFSISDGVARGSGRSVGSVDLFKAVSQCDDLLIRYGGHSGAVGVTIDAVNIDAFRARMEEILEDIPEEQFYSTSEVIPLDSLENLTIENIDSLEDLQPFGQGNPRPLFCSENVLLTNSARVGQTQDHLRFYAADGEAFISSIMFRAPHIERAIDCDQVVDLVFDPVVESWHGKRGAKLIVKDILYHEPEKPDENSLAARLFDSAFDILSRDEYASLVDAESFYTKIVGVSFEGRQNTVATLKPEEELNLVRDRENPYDPQAIQVVRSTGEQVGFIRKQIAGVLAPLMDSGVTYKARVMQVTGDAKTSRGANIIVERISADGCDDEEAKEIARIRKSFSEIPYDELTEKIRSKLIGSYDFLPAQKAALDLLEQKKNVLCTMATGRGKSAIFQVHAAREAIAHNKASVFVFPLRALVSDQAYHLEKKLGELGLNISTLTGETPQAQREETFKKLTNGGLDIVLTTPEFLTIHDDEFAQTGRIGFVVIDESHHAGESKKGKRSSYQGLPQTLEKLGNPQVLAVSATAEDETAREIMRLCSVDEENVIVDDTVRSNLHLVDQRSVKNRDMALITCVARGEKCVIYVNSREQTVKLAKILRDAIPQLGHKIAFYNAGLTRSERNMVEEAFRTGELNCIVSTSAFGEGVNIPDIRHVFLYHMPFGSIEFNQMSGRAGRDGEDAFIHLMYSERDAAINEHVLEGSAPNRDALIALYKALKMIQKKNPEEAFVKTNAELAALATDIDKRSKLDERSVSCGISVFKELGFLETTGHGPSRRIRMIDKPLKVELTDSIRYLEGMRSMDEFLDFKTWALSSPADILLARINRPIVPSFGKRTV